MRFQAERVPCAIAGPTLAAAVGKKIGGIELYAGLCGFRQHGDAGNGRGNRCGGTQRAVPVVYSVVVIVASSFAQLRKVIVDADYDDCRGAEVHRRSFHRIDGSQNETMGVDGSIARGIYGQLVIHGGCGGVAAKIKIAVIG